MKTYKYFAAFTAILFSMTSCNYSEDELESSGELTSYQLPQGNHDYDTTIQEQYDKYGYYLLYKFSDKDAYWTPTGWQNGEATSETSEGKSGYTCQPAEENYVAGQLKMLDEILLSNLNDAARKELLPRKILLCSEVNTMEQKYVFSPSFHVEMVPVPIYAKYNFDNISVAGGSEAGSNMDDTQKAALRQAFCIEWAAYITERKAAPSDEFTNSISYSSKDVTNAYSPLDCAAVGILCEGYNASPTKDWNYFICMMLGFSEEYLTEDSGDASSWYSFGTYLEYYYAKNFHGILNETKDTKGILKKRYDIVRTYFKKNFNVDLQEIGNKNIM